MTLAWISLEWVSRTWYGYLRSKYPELDVVTSKLQLQARSQGRGVSGGKVATSFAPPPLPEKFSNATKGGNEVNFVSFYLKDFTPQNFALPPQIICFGYDPVQL